METNATHIIETAYFEVKPGTQADFERAFTKAQLVISRAEGYCSHTLQRCIETDHKYLLLVTWTSIEAHTTGFRKSELFAEWRALIGPFFAKTPVVEHYRTLPF